MTVTTATTDDYGIYVDGEWEAGDDDRLVDGLRELRSTDFRRESDLGRFIAGSDPYLVR